MPLPYNTLLVIGSTALLGLAAGLVGSFLLLRKRSLMGDVLSHATLPGIALAFALGSRFGLPRSLPLLLAGATVTGILGMLALVAIRRGTRLRDDVAMGIVLSVFFGAGTALVGMVQNLPGATGLESFIYGKTASIVAGDLQLIAAVAAAATLLVLLLRKELTLLCFDEAFAATQGWPTLLLDLLLLAAVVAVTVVGLQAVGLILIIAFLIIPPAAARFWTEHHGFMLALSAVLGGVSAALGAVLSASFDRLPAGAVIVLTGAGFFVLSLLLGRARGLLPRLLAARKLRRKIGRQHLLRALYELLEADEHPEHPRLGFDGLSNQPVALADLAAHRGWHGNELAGLLARARRQQLVVADGPPQQVQLSPAGLAEAGRITRSHRLWEQYLIEHADIAPSHVDRDADQVEHVLSPELIARLERKLQPVAAMPPNPHRKESGQG